MLKAKIILVAMSVTLATPQVLAGATPEEDRKEAVEYFKQMFPDVPLTEFVNGQYALNEDRRSQWQSLQDFPPYEFAVADGQEMFETPFANGKTYASCFENDGIGIRQNYPRFDENKKEVITLELAINQCREVNGEKPLKYKKGDIASISAYMASTSKGKQFDIKVPDNPEALAAYEDGKEFYYSRRGQLNFSCAGCHVQNPGKWIRADLLSPALGQPSNFPVHRSKWGELGTLHRRFAGCNANVRAEPLAAQSEEYRNLEYFLTYMSNGLSVVGPEYPAIIGNRDGRIEMMNKPLLTIGLSLSLWVPLCAQAGVKEDFQKIYSEAESAHKDAGNFQWTTTTARLKTAESAAESGDYEKAKAMAAEALQLANESVAQRKKQAEAWKNIAIGG